LHKSLQHKSLLPFVKKVIVAKVKLCSKAVSDHRKKPSNTQAADIIPPVVEYCKRKMKHFAKNIYRTQTPVLPDAKLGFVLFRVHQFI
jgi:hypothetical protein